MRLLILSGLPGAGKTTYARWLEARAWGRLSVDHPSEAPLGLASAWWRALDGDDTTFRAIAADYAGLVVEWGFPPTGLPRLKEMIDRGYDAWYFDGDHDAALASWKTAWPETPEEAWRGQVDGLEAIMPDIRIVYGRKLIVTVMPGPVHVTPEEIHRHIEPTLRSWP